MKYFKKVMMTIVSILSAVVLVACGNDSSMQTEEGKGTVGIAMPTQSAERWIDDGNNMVDQLEELGYETILQYGEDDVQNQVSQIENMITRGVDYLVIAAVDGAALTDVLEMAAEEEITVVAYDRLLMNSEHVNYYVTFDNLGVGILTAEYIEDKLNLKDGEGPYNIELFAGSPSDNVASTNYDGYMTVLEKYIDNGQLEVQSGQTEFNQIATLRWDAATAQERMDNLLSAHYTDKNIDAILSPYDPMTLSIISSLKGVGYGTDDLPLPITTGQDANIPTIKSIIAGEQDMTIFKDTRILATSTVDVIESVSNEDTIEIDDEETYDNEVKIVPTILEKPIVVDKDNYKEMLIDSEYYTEEELE